MKPVNPALGATRTCPHCRSTILQSSTVCPACRHFLRFDTVKGATKGVTSIEPMRVEAIVRQPEDGNGCEYSLVVTVRNDRGEELTRQVIAVGGMKPSEARIFSVWVETYSPEDRQEPATLGKTAEPNGRD
ncbi:MAG TPA: hypothetical protein VGL11_04675 [Candidatus Binatia bacterium]|jgi:hypothetical protein